MQSTKETLSLIGILCSVGVGVGVHLTVFVCAAGHLARAYMKLCAVTDGFINGVKNKTKEI